MPFTLTLAAARDAQFQAWSFQSAEVFVDTDTKPVAIISSSGNSDEDLAPSNLSSIGKLVLPSNDKEPRASSARLDFHPGSKITLAGSLTSQVLGSVNVSEYQAIMCSTKPIQILQIDRVTLVHKRGPWTLRVPCAILSKAGNIPFSDSVISTGLR